jgi:hypothetical protein
MHRTDDVTDVKPILNLSDALGMVTGAVSRRLKSHWEAASRLIAVLSGDTKTRSSAMNSKIYTLLFGDLYKKPIELRKCMAAQSDLAVGSLANGMRNGF